MLTITLRRHSLQAKNQQCRLDISPPPWYKLFLSQARLFLAPRLHLKESDGCVSPPSFPFCLLLGGIYSPSL